jgi:hypothetical protein
MPTNLLSMVINDENLQLEKYFCLFLVIGLTDSAASRLQYFSTLASYRKFIQLDISILMTIQRKLAGIVQQKFNYQNITKI